MTSMSRPTSLWSWLDRLPRPSLRSMHDYVFNPSLIPIAHPKPALSVFPQSHSIFVIIPLSLQPLPPVPTAI